MNAEEAPRRERPRAVVDNIPVVMFALDRDGAFILFEGRGLETLGFKQGEVVGRSIFEVCRGEPRVLGDVRRALAGEHVASTTEASGEAFESRYSPLRDEGGKVTGVVGVFADATGRERVEEATENDEWLRSLVRYASDVITMLEADGTIRYESPAVEKVLGYRPEELVGENAFRYIHPNDEERARRAFADALGRPGAFPTPVEYRFRHADGSWRHLESVGNNLLEKASVGGVVIGSRDITERKRAQIRLQETEARYRTLVEQIPAVTHIDRADGSDEIVYTSPQIEGMLGYTPEEWRENGLWEKRLHPDDRERILAADERLEVEGEPFSEEYRLLHRDGHVVWVREEAVLVTDEAGEPLFWQGVLFDITGRKEAEEALRRSQTGLAEAQRMARLGSWEWDVVTGDLSWSDEVFRIYGYPPGRFVPTFERFMQIVHPADRELLRSSLDAAFYGGEPYGFDHRIVLPDGGERVVHRQAEVVFDGEGRPLRMIGTVHDITGRKRAEARLRDAEKRFRTLVEHIPAVTYTRLLKFGDTGFVGYISPQIEALLGHAPEDFVREPELWKESLHPEDRERVLAEHERTDEAGEPFSMEYRFSARDGRTVWVRDEAVSIRGEAGEPLYWQGFFVDLTERKALEEQLEHRSLHDALTGLANRALFLDRLRHARERADRRRTPFAVLFVDLDDFKRVNDSLGHEAGDRLLVAVSRRLSTCSRPGDTVARLGGDEFTVLLENVADAAEATRVAERMAEDLRSAFILGGHAVFVTASIGIVLGTTPHASTEDLLRDADRAMYRAKEGGKARCEVFDLKMGARFSERLRLEGDLRRAVGNPGGQFTVRYQPEVSAQTGEIFGFEALVRWERAGRGPIPPSEFVPLAEETGLIVPIGRLVLEEACRNARGWQERRPAHEPLAVSVNLSLRQFRQSDLAAEVAGVLRKTGLAARDLILEITENVAMEDAERTAATLGELKALGVRVAINHFGTGHASPIYLIKRFGMDLLKIDRSFVGELAEDPANATMLSSILGMSRALGMRTVVEGVESAEHLALLRELGADVVQGLYLAGPMASDAVDGLLDASGSGHPRTDRRDAPGVRH